MIYQRQLGKSATLDTPPQQSVIAVDTCRASCNVHAGAGAQLAIDQHI